MKKVYFITAKPGAKFYRVEEIGNNQFKVWVKEPAREGKANKALLKILSQHLGVPRKNLRIIQGERGRKKLVELQE